MDIGNAVFVKSIMEMSFFFSLFFIIKYPFLSEVGRGLAPAVCDLRFPRRGQAPALRLLYKAFFGKLNYFYIYPRNDLIKLGRYALSDA